MSRAVTERDLRIPEFRDVEDPDSLEFRKDGKIVRKDRWEKTIYWIVGIVGWSRREFELSDLVNEVENRVNTSLVNWHAVADFGEPEDKEVLMYSPDMRNPTDMLIGKFIDGQWMSGGYEMVNVTHWADKPLHPTEQVAEQGNE